MPPRRGSQRKAPPKRGSTRHSGEKVQKDALSPTDVSGTGQQPSPHGDTVAECYQKMEENKARKTVAQMTEYNMAKWKIEVLLEGQPESHRTKPTDPRPLLEKPNNPIKPFVDPDPARQRKLENSVAAAYKEFMHDYCADKRNSRDEIKEVEDGFVKRIVDEAVATILKALKIPAGRSAHNKVEDD